ncbi:MAG: NAD(P)-dependent oxidoreductase [Burkholderiaceae bacterium]|nr:NAD(P)-dependent oxidoreductase [Burkholderiaceae bacterium]
MSDLARGEKFPVGIVGVGNMGGGMARNLLARGWPVHVHDVEIEKTANLKPFGALAPVDAGQVAIESEVLIVCVVDAAQTRDVLFGAGGAAAALAPGRAVMLCPTIAPADVESIAQTLAGQGLHTIDAPMSGGPVRAQDGSMSLMVACADAVFEVHRGLIEALSSRVFRIGERVGDGARTKLVNNLLAGINLVGAAEALALAGRMGLDLTTTLDVMQQSSGQSWIGEDRLRRALAGDYAPRAHTTLLAKDTRLALEAAASLGVQPALGSAASAAFWRAIEHGLGGEDDASVFKLLRNTG